MLCRSGEPMEVLGKTMTASRLLINPDCRHSILPASPHPPTPEPKLKTQDNSGVSARSGENLFQSFLVRTGM